MHLINLFSVETVADYFSQQGIAVKGNETQLSHYTDDTTFVLYGSEEPFLESV